MHACVQRNTAMCSQATYSQVNTVHPQNFSHAADTAALGKANFQKYYSALPSDASSIAVGAGGWSALEQMAADPKAEFAAMIASNLSSSDGRVKQGGAIDDGRLNGLVALLQARGRGFDADLIDGTWLAVLSRQGKQSPQVQKLVSSKSRVKKAYANFHVAEGIFENESYTPHGRGTLRATVAYNPTNEAYDIGADGKTIVLRRISCDITGASFQYRKLPKLPLPLKKKGGYLDVLYLDDDMRITRGNRGGLFVHFRPDFLNKVTQPADFHQALLEEKILQDKKAKKSWLRRLFRRA